MRKVRRGEVGTRFLFRAVDTQLFPNPVRKGLPTNRPQNRLSAEPKGALRLARLTVPLRRFVLPVTARGEYRHSQGHQSRIFCLGLPAK